MRSGEVLGSTYELGDEIAHTETGVVYEARDMLLDRLVALKLAAGKQSLVVEARRCAAVRDPCAVQVHGMGVHRGAEYAIAERVTGKLLHEEVGRAPLPIDLYLARLRTLIAAVVRAHEAGIAVGDISGSTVLVVPDAVLKNTVRARLVLGRLSLSQVPAFGPHGQILAPEVVRGEVEASDPAAAEMIDLYGLGCIAIEMACGTPPFAAADREVELQGHASSPPPRIGDLRPDLPGELSDLVEWMLAKQPLSRPRSAQDVLAQVEAVIERSAAVTRTMRVLIVDADAARARWLWNLVRRAHSATVVETANDGSDAAHKLNRDQPDLVFVNVNLGGVMNALELCMYARGLDMWDQETGRLFLLGTVPERDVVLFEEVNVEVIQDTADLPGEILDRVRAAMHAKPRARWARTTVSG